MSDADGAETQTAAQSREAGHGIRWWLRVAEIRLRFVVIVLLILAVVTQWERMRGTYDAWWHSRHRLSATSAVSPDLEFFCPMDPGVVSIWPAICPICNMDLVQRHKHDARLLPEGVVARMQLSPYRVQLAGIKTVVVEARDCVIEIPVFGTLMTPPDDLAANGPAGELWLQAPISQSDERLLTLPRAARVRRTGDSHEYAGVATIHEAKATGPEATRTLPQVIVRVAALSGLQNGTPVTAVIQVPLGEGGDSGAAAAHPLPAVPGGAVVDHGFQQLVFVESMPGMFDATPVKLGPRCGDYYPVLSGLQPGARIASVGAFLIDAEARLNPSLAVAYFGASQAEIENRIPRVQVAESKASPLSANDLRLADLQKTCPVTNLPLNSMGGPVPIDLQGRRVFICCKGCESKLRSDPEPYLAKLPR